LNGGISVHTAHHILPIKMHNAKNTITLDEDDFLNISVSIYIDKKGDYKLSKDARVASLVYLLKLPQDATNELYVFNICLVSNEQLRTQV